jgi:hypothetical protein
MVNESRIAAWALGIALTVGVFTGGGAEAEDAGQPAIGSATWKARGLDAARDHPVTRRIFGSLSEESLQALTAGADPARVFTTTGRPLAEVLTAVVGEIDAQLVFTPLTPCRLIDTRNAGGAFAAGEQRNYDLLRPADYSSIGGNPAGCGLPGEGGFEPLFTYNQVRALVLNIVAVGPAGPGDLRAFPTNEGVPLASVINYASIPGAGLNIANGIILKTCSTFCVDLGTGPCGDPCPLGDLSFLAAVSATHLVVDVVGYFVAPFGPRAVTESSGEGPALTSTCQEILSCSVTNSVDGDKEVLVVAQVNLEVEHTLGVQDEAHFKLSSLSAECPAGGSPFNVQNAAVFDVPATYPTTARISGTVTLMETFLVLAQSTGTFYLNGRMDSGDSAGDKARWAKLVCLNPYATRR